MARHAPHRDRHLRRRRALRRRQLRALTGRPADPWAVLGVAPTATDDEIHAAYRRLAARHHPDRPGGDASLMAEINAAYAATRVPARAARSEPTVATTVAAEPAPAGRPLGCAPFVALGVVIAAITMLVVVAFAGRTDDPATPETSRRPAAPAATTTAGRDPAPWREQPLAEAESRLAVSVWRRSPARDACPLVVPLGADAGGTARVVDVERGWGIAWGLLNEGPQFGVLASIDDPAGAPGAAELTWADGSRANLRAEPGRIVAEVSIRGIDCTYSVFSTVGFEHLAQVLGALRFVDA